MPLLKPGPHLLSAYSSLLSSGSPSTSRRVGSAVPVAASAVADCPRSCCRGPKWTDRAGRRHHLRARKYYFDGKTKSELAAEFRLSRFKIARILEDAVARGGAVNDPQTRGDGPRRARLGVLRRKFA